MTVAVERPEQPQQPEPPRKTDSAPPAASPAARLRRVGRGTVVAAILIAWLLLFAVLRGKQTLTLAAADLTDLHRWINDLNDSVGANRNSNPLFLYFFNEIRLVIDTLVTFIQELISQPSADRPLPQIGWLGVVGIAGYVSWAVGNWRVALLAVAGFTFLGLQGLWQESMDTLALTVSAVCVALLFAIPLGVWAGLSERFNRFVTPFLDFMQTMPTFVYLAPLTLFFLIGGASATIATVIYAAPPAIRITAHAIRSVPETTVEAADSLGATRWQGLLKVLLPMSKRTVVMGVNQSIMAALAMVTIAALIDAPGLGKTVLQALQSLDVGTAFNAGLAIVVMAIVLDRVTTAASARQEAARRSTGRFVTWRRPLLAAGGVVTAVLVYMSHTYVWAAEFPGEGDVGSSVARAADTTTTWVQDSLAGLTNAFRDALTNGLLNPFQSLLTDSPWWLVAAVLIALGTVLGGWRAGVTAAVCLGLLLGTGLWSDSMTTLASTLVATVLVMVLGMAFGVWMGRSALVDRVLRPTLDAAQVMPPFVYLVPFLALFGATRFTAIVAAIVYAAPVAIKIIADGVRAVPATTVEAATAAGCNTWQIITKVQLPMSRSALTLATNQGLIYVLSMVVVGGLVGAGALGYDVVAGFSQGQLYGKGLAAGLAIVLLGVMFDRITQAAARRVSA
ncbi:MULTISPECIES: ABC transporter permease [Streptomyces]|uniref:Glycine betaine/proline transport system permease protein n=1 Tax=Streptomyces stelliscabiei TaxID=146820 RepID=A0A8I0TWQ4_9ACTN|nr:MULTISPECIES: ABC transporter permease subunit [Streptomyces]KND42449.1 ABC transporter permease [Streptomyces stelliscabiei]MBE1602301.1 glycine betaine/proline transport system permease protein [Streptomyces stelliscabiei]MDX2522563.1 ABC transporter permease subunit [Streptomyces stelliscabiei]MDX2552232.1 ABC transporter permease subunit [Streptomyces stelliscabiei]MDX2611627.1 ABC transporter permease subunit [Streptomyces stelliscabiei]